MALTGTGRYLDPESMWVALKLRTCGTWVCWYQPGDWYAGADSKTKFARIGLVSEASEACLEPRYIGTILECESVRTSSALETIRTEVDHGCARE
jgi:hypothetical protein